MAFLKIALTKKAWMILSLIVHYLNETLTDQVVYWNQKKLSNTKFCFYPSHLSPKTIKFKISKISPKMSKMFSNNTKIDDVSKKKILDNFSHPTIKRNFWQYQ